jgi:hypothetical protein
VRVKVPTNFSGTREAQFVRITNKASTFLTLYFCNVSNYELNTGLALITCKNRKSLEKRNQANQARPATDKDRKNRGLSADLSSYHDGALPGSRVEDPLPQTQ